MTKAEDRQAAANLEQLVRIAADEISKGSITFSQVLAIIAPSTVEDAGVPEVFPVPQAITLDQAKALENLTEVFGKVVPAERRALTPAEVEDLVEEKQVLDELKRLAVSRGENIRTTIFNHLDVKAEEEGRTTGVPRDKDGHYILNGEAHPERDVLGQKFTREVRNGAPHLSLAALEALIDDPTVDFSRQDFLSITSQVRVVDENKLLLRLKKNPRLILAISKATQAGRKVASMNLRKY